VEKPDLSPLLFNIFIRRLPQHCISATLQFADDTTLATAAGSSLAIVADNLTASFSCVKDFCETHELVINSSKTQLIVLKPVGRRIPDEFHLLLDNCTVTPQKTVKLLGVTFDQHFTFGPHSEMSSLNVMDFSEHWLKPLRISRGNYSNFPTQLSSDLVEYCSSLFTSAAKTHSFIHSFIYLHSSKNIIHNKMYMQDNKAAYATTVALYNWEIKHYCTSKTH